MSELTWRRSSKCEAHSCVEVAWRKSSRSINNGTCIEVGPTPTAVLVRDSKDIAGPTLGFTPTAWRAFLTGLRAGNLRP